MQFTFVYSQFRKPTYSCGTYCSNLITDNDSLRYGPRYLGQTINKLSPSSVSKIADSPNHTWSQFQAAIPVPISNLDSPIANPAGLIAPARREDRRWNSFNCQHTCVLVSTRISVNLDSFIVNLRAASVAITIIASRSEPLRGTNRMRKWL